MIALMLERQLEQSLRRLAADAKGDLQPAES
jgi:hypothetical protein